MDCRRARAAVADRLTGNLPEGARSELERHLTTCSRCREEAASLGATWQSLAGLSAPAPDQELVARFRKRLDDVDLGMGDVPPSRAGLRRITWAASLAAVFLGGAFAGYAVGMSRGGGAGGGPPWPEFLLLLHEPPHAARLPAEAALVQEYTEWATRLARDGMLVDAHKLADEPAVWLAGTKGVLDPETAPGAAGGDAVIGGYFVIQASDRERAVAVARTSPHLKYGGMIELRAIER